MPPELSQQIAQLSPDNQARVAEYVAFLRWQETRHIPAQRWTYSLIEAFPRADIYASSDPSGMDVDLGPATVGNESKSAVWAHPPVSGQAIISYYVPVPPQVREVHLNVAVGIRDGAQMAPNNLVAFSVRVNGMRVWGQQTNAQSWQPAAIPLDVVSGDIAHLELTTEALNGHEWTWAVWGAPELTGVMTA